MPAPLQSNLARRRGDRDLFVIDRDARLLKLRPLPPRPVSLTAGVLLWEHARSTANITHYRIYNVDGQIFAEVPVGQTKLVGFDTDRAYLTSYDSRTELESYQASVVGTGAANAAAPVEYSLTSASTNITALGTGTTGEVRYVILETDGTAGRQIVWDASFIGVTVDDIFNTANSTNIYGFMNRNSDEWWLVSKIFYATP